MFDGNENTDWYESPKNENVIQIQTIFLLRLILKTLHDDDVFPRLLCIFPVAFFLIWLDPRVLKLDTKFPDPPY